MMGGDRNRALQIRHALGKLWFGLGQAPGETQGREPQHGDAQALVEVVGLEGRGVQRRKFGHGETGPGSPEDQHRHDPMDQNVDDTIAGVGVGEHARRLDCLGHEPILLPIQLCGNRHGHIVGDMRREQAEVEIRALEGGRGVEAGHMKAFDNRGWTGGVEPNIQGHRLGDALDGQIARDLGGLLAGHFDDRADEGRDRMFLDIEEIRAPEMLVTLSPIGVQSGEVEGDLDMTVRRSSSSSVTVPSYSRNSRVVVENPKWLQRTNMSVCDLSKV